uniref:ATP synthase subunit c n=1 Tax=Candidatus Caldatribacterium californiense TaxID=1454726 RepID=A0A7V3YKY4_9BACT
MQGEILFLCITVFTAGFSIALGVMFPAIGQGKACSQALESIARQPEAAGPISRTLFVGLAMLESLAIYVLVVSFILLFANPLLRYVFK